MTARALRILLVANDGFSAGHVARTLAIASGLRRRAAARALEVRLVLATTSQADELLRGEPVVVRLPAPASARSAGFSDAERRRLVRSTIDGLVEGFAPDVVVADTFPNGPHGELAGVGRRAKRVVVRRAVVDERPEALVDGLGDCELAIVAGDPDPIGAVGGVPTVHVPPITLGEPRDALSRADARRALGLSLEGRAILVAAGGGGDADALGRARELAVQIAERLPDAIVVLALGPLAADATLAPDGGGRSQVTGRIRLVEFELPEALDADMRVHVVRIAPLGPVLAAFDGAVSPAGYNTTYELAKARVPALLFAQPRPFDDQAARAVRMAAAGFARVLDVAPPATIDLAAGLAWLASARVPELPLGGADRAADALLDFATGRSAR